MNTIMLAASTSELLEIDNNHEYLTKQIYLHKPTSNCKVE